METLDSDSFGYINFSVSEGLNSVETRLCHTGKAKVACVSEGLNSVETSVLGQ